MRSTRHSRYNINYHLVWIPKYREPMLVGDAAGHLSEIFRLIAEKKGIEILGMEIMPDYVHLFVSAPPQYSPSLLVNWFKGISARMYNYWYGRDAPIRWTNSYYVGTAGTVTSETIKKYIEEQRSR
ncbi:IS200/IS605 family transposase [Methanothrix sp.]|uniref:IS200/IS605 family transposase n=1 Tax=Methanothrix sp. TaxID=90426 RepID=UPI0034E2A189